MSTAKQPTKSGASKKMFGSASLDNAFLSNQSPLSTSALLNVLAIHCAKAAAGEHNPWDINCTTSWGLLIVGPAGVGKSSVVQNFARAQGMDFMRVMMGEANDLDSTGVLEFSKDGFARDEHGHHKFTLPSHLPVRPPKNGIGIAFIDEVGTGSAMDQNRVASLLTAGYHIGYYGHRIHPGWVWVAATNPDESEYHLNMQLDARVRDRFLVVSYGPSAPEIIQHLSVTNKIPEMLMKFLRMNESVFESATPRKWEQIGGYISRWLRLNNMSPQEFGNMLRLELPEDAVSRLVAFFELGNNPDEFPLSAKQIAYAEKDEEAVQQSRVKRWVKNNRADLIAATAFDIGANLADASFGLGKPEATKLIKIIELFETADLVSQVLNQSQQQPDRQRMLSELIVGKSVIATQLRAALQNMSK